MVAYHSEAAIQIKGVYYYAGYSVDQTRIQSLWVRCSNLKVYQYKRGDLTICSSENITCPVEPVPLPIRLLPSEEKKKYAFQLLTKLKNKSKVRVIEARPVKFKKQDSLVSDKLLSWSAVVFQKN